jgi:protein-S-isoprenylcysteine O-methyltransferase Ste14
MAVFHDQHRIAPTDSPATVAVGLVSLLAVTPSLELVSSMINFGALVAFTAVNLSVLAWFAVRRRQFRTVKQVASTGTVIRGPGAASSREHFA